MTTCVKPAMTSALLLTSLSGKTWVVRCVSCVYRIALRTARAGEASLLVRAVRDAGEVADHEEKIDQPECEPRSCNGKKSDRE